MLYPILGLPNTTMLEFIGIMTVIYLIAMGLARLFGGKQPKREIYIIREYEIKDDMDAYLQPEQLPEEQESQPRKEALPDNVVAIHRKKQ
jgi:hypothetical protein